MLPFPWVTGGSHVEVRQQHEIVAIDTRPFGYESPTARNRLVNVSLDSIPICVGKQEAGSVRFTARPRCGLYANKCLKQIQSDTGNVTGLQGWCS
jgi:hypothetical protein